ncbi:MAG TPA: trehalase family glycosidase [Patescibacteria group bacterium]|nr:trehalase family glycosidase [Patescibacteria group bacterium]
MAIEEKLNEVAEVEPQKELLGQAKAVLAMNDQGSHTIPAEGLYPHQWLWDSCFIAIGLRHVDVERAKQELLSLLRGQWSNGMLPHMIFASGDAHRRDRNLWRSWVNPYAPSDVTTSGITQPPMLAEAVVRVGEKLSQPERRTWYHTVYPALLAHHQWLYKERDPHEEGLALQIHPYEVGLDNTPPWLAQLHEHSRPWWIAALEKTHVDKFVNLFRRDTKHVPPGQRMKNTDALLYYDVIRRLRRKRYNIDSILTRSLFAIEDLTFNSVLVRANHCLQHIASNIRQDLPEELEQRMHKTERALEQLWDGYSGQYYSRNFVTHKLIKEPTIATLLPLYAGSVSSERAQQLVTLLTNKHLFGANYPVPSVPLNSSWFEPLGYWQGPSWVNTNWLIIDGLRRYKFHKEAEWLQQRTLELVETSGMNEYFSPVDGKPAGAANFSWTAALTIDLLQE